jgi:hypothetical protein
MRPQLDRRRRIAIECLALDHLADEPAHRREATALAGYAKLARRKVFEIAEDRRRIQRARLDAALAAEVLKVAKVTAVGLERVLAEAALDRLSRQMELDQIIPAEFAAVVHILNLTFHFNLQLSPLDAIRRLWA